MAEQPSTAPAGTDLTRLSATELRAAYRARELSPVEVLDAVQARAEAVEPRVNAFAERLDERARAAAVEAEARYAGRGAEPRPLEGIPVAVKEEQPIAGHAWRMGSLTTSDEPVDETDPVAERVLAAGATVHARTTTPEFSCAGFTHSRLWGVTRNPWQLDVAPGGSSGGSAAALAAGTAHLATGSDIGGSVRIPASLCGVVGFKPPYGRVPVLPPMNLDAYCHNGSMARTVADCALLENVIAGPHRADPVTLPAAPPIPDLLDGWQGVRVAYATAVGDYPLAPEVVANTKGFADALREAGLVVDEVELPIRRETVCAAMYTHFGAIFGPSIGDIDDTRLTPYARRFARRAAAMLDEVGFFHGLELETQVQATVGAVFEQYDALVCPTLGTDGFAADDDYVDHGVAVAGVELDDYMEACLTPIFNIASRHPVLAVPSGHAGNGVPTGVQIAGRPYDDHTPFVVGRAAETVLGWWHDPAWQPVL